MVKARDYTFCMIVVEQFATKLHIKLVTKFFNSLVNFFSLNLQILL